jgi:hypothetical protein
LNPFFSCNIFFLLGIHHTQQIVGLYML